MTFSFSILNSKRKLENAIFVTIIVFLLKIILPSPQDFFSYIFNELILSSLIYFWYIYLNDIIKEKSEKPLTIILNIAVLIAILIFIYVISSFVWGRVLFASEDKGLLIRIISALIGGGFLGVVLYIFSSMRILFFLKQKKDPKFYFSLMSYFFIAAYFTNFVDDLFPEYNFITNSIYIVAIILIVINSIRVAWVAFLSKKQKMYLLGGSVFLSILFGINYALLLDKNNFLNQVIHSFSPGFEVLMQLLMLYGSIYFGVVFFTTLFHLPTAEAFDRKAEEVTLLADFSKIITQVFDFNELADSVISATKKVCNSDVAWLAIKGEDGLEIVAVHNIEFAEANKVMSSIFQSDVPAIEAVEILNEYSVKIASLDVVRYLRFESLAVAPLKVHSKINGYLFAGNLKYYVFDDDDKKAIGAFADYAAVALENSLLIKESIEKERLENELNVAREIQYKIIPTTLPEVDNLDIATAFLPAFEVGGDYFDFFRLSDSKLGFVIADVSGKGISAAFIMAEVKGIFTSLANLVEEPQELLSSVNEILCKSLIRKDFVTAIYGILDAENGKLIFSRAGHMPLLIARGDEVLTFSPKGLGIGIERGGNYSEYLEQMEIKLNNNDIVCLFTDGITEAQNKQLINYGMDRFQKLILNNKNNDVDNLANTIMQEISLYTKDHRQHDDITLVLFRWVNNKTNGEN